MRRLVIIAVFQLTGIGALATYHEYVWATAPRLRLPLEPRDPFDLMRGRYFILNPRDSTIDLGSRESYLTEAKVERFLASETYFSGRALVGLCPVEAHHRLCSLYRWDETPPFEEAPFWSLGFVTIAVDGGRGKAPPVRVRVDLELDRFFLPAGAQLPGRETDSGWEIEVAYRFRQTLLPYRLWFRGRPVTRP